MAGKDANTISHPLIVAGLISSAIAMATPVAFAGEPVQTHGDELVIPDSEIRRALRSAFTPQATTLDRSDAELTLPMDVNGSRSNFTFVGLFETEVGYSQLAELDRQQGDGMARSELTSYFARAGVGTEVMENLRASLLIGAGAFYSSVSSFTSDGAQLSDARPQELAFSGWVGFGLRYRLNDKTELRFSWELYDNVLLPQTGFAGDISQWRMILENRW